MTHKMPTEYMLKILDIALDSFEILKVSQHKISCMAGSDVILPTTFN